MSKIEKIFGFSVLFAVIILISCVESRSATRGTGLFDSKTSKSGKNSYQQSDEVVFSDEDSPSSEEIEFEDNSESNQKREADYVKRESDGSGSENQDAGFDQKGLASWYGREFHGRKTASGEKFDMYNMTAAHKTLPFGTIVKVTSIKTGKQIKVMINDRGPYKNGRIIDLSYAAGRELGILASGEASVGVTVLKLGSGKTSSRDSDVKGVSGEENFLIEENDVNTPDEFRNANSDVSSGSYEIQAGAFYSIKNAEKVRARIESSTGCRVIISEDGDLYKVKLVNVRNKTEAERIMRNLENENIRSILLQK